MRALSKAALGGSVVSALTVGGLVAGGVFATSATLVITDPTAPRASADSLTRFDSCSALRSWYVDRGVRAVGPYGWSGPIMYADDTAGVPLATLPGAATAEKSAPVSGTTDARSSSGTGTNTQEADVDEPDVAKTDGRRVVRLVDQRTVVISDVTGATPRELGRVSLPVDAYGGELLLVGDHVLVSEATGNWKRPMTMTEVVPGTSPGTSPGSGTAESVAPDTTVGTVAMPPGGSRVIDVDISDPASPRIVHDDTFSGRQVSMRQYGDTVRVVTATQRPELRWLTPGRHVSPAQAVRHNRDLVRATTLSDWLPSVTDNLASPGHATGLLGCNDVYHPAAWSGDETTAVTTYDVRSPSRRHSVAITADGQVVYSSANRLYVASTRYAEPRPWGAALEGSTAGSRMMPIRPMNATTQLHAFALDGTSTTYAGSGHVTGSVRDRWSLDEHAGRLRVAWTRTNNQGRSQNGITILSEQHGALVPTGTIDRLGIDENLQSVRWFDDLAVLVTFRQMDPLYTIDLTDQDHPRALGQLRIPGYSGYLHPLGGSRLLGLGVDATGQGRSLGGQAAVFDIADLTSPRRLSTVGFGEQSSLPALDDPRAFTWLPDAHTAVTSVASWTTDRARLVALHVTATGQLEARDLDTSVGWNARTLPLADGRIAVVDNDLQVLSLG